MVVNAEENSTGLDVGTRIAEGILGDRLSGLLDMVAEENSIELD